jgi:hypothetical protein
MVRITPILAEVSDSAKFEQVFKKVIIEMFGKESGDWRSAMQLPHGVIDSSWTTGRHISNLSRELRDRIYEKAASFLKKKVNKFDTNKTKLSEDLVDLNDIWIEISNWVGEKIEEQARKEGGKFRD